jgi:virginiamycin B lyase
VGQRLGRECDCALRSEDREFESFPLPDSYANVRQLAGRKGEVWGAESGADKLFVLKAE